MNYVGVARVRPERAGARGPAVRGRAAARSHDRERARQPRGRARASAPARARAAALAARDRPARRCAPRSSTWRNGRARGPPPGSISLCMIVRDEEEMLAACLESCREARLGDDRRRHGLERPDGGDRRVVRRSRAALRVDGQLRRGAQRRRRRGDRRLDPLARRRRAARARRRGTARRADARAVARGALARRDQLHGAARGGDGIAAPRPAALAEPAAVPLLARDPRADPQLDAVRPDGALRAAGAADPPLRLPQEPHRRARQAPAQPRAAARRARGEPARRLHALQHRHRVRRHGRPRVRATALRAGPGAAPRGARLVGARLRADPRLPPLRRSAADRRSRRLRGACERAARALPGVHGPRLRARAGRTGPRRARAGRRALRAVPRDGRRAAALLGRGRTRLVPRARSARARRDEPRPSSTRPRAGSSDRSSCTRSTSPPVST